MQFLLAATFAALAVAMPPSYGSSAPSYGNSAPSYGESAPSYGESSAPAPVYKAPATTPAAEYPAQTSVPVAAEPICTVGWSSQCCQTDVLGLVGLTCNAPSFDVNSKQSLVDDCATTGTTAQCCLIPVAGEALICQDV